MKIISVVGARPNFMKIAPFCKAIDEHNSSTDSLKIDHKLVHTGQHYDVRMSEAFFTALGIPDPDINLEVGSGTHAEQVGNTMIEFEKVLIAEKPDWVVVVGDVNATLACSVTAKKLWIKCCHIEAGLRSGDMKMPEEINRLVTDHLSDLLLTPDKLSNKNLIKEGIPESKIKFVGNIMIDTLEANRGKAEKLNIVDIINNNLPEHMQEIADIPGDKDYVLVTMHRPSNVDQKEVLEPIIDFFCKQVSKEQNIIWTLHPRTKKFLQQYNLYQKLVDNPQIIILEPLGYFDMLRLNMGARIMLTDSGGLQEECTVLGTPCLTLRWNTERPVTLKEHGGACVLVGNNIQKIKSEYYTALNQATKPIRPELWDGKTAQRCLESIIEVS